jgi:hypothetical protein
MASREGDAYHEVVFQGNPMTMTLDGTPGCIHDVRSLIMRASNVLDESQMLTFLETLSSVMSLKEGKARSILGVDQFLWFPLSKDLHTREWLCDAFMTPYKLACAKLMESTRETDPFKARKMRYEAKIDLEEIYRFLT